MRITKHEHATMRVDEASRTLVIDPGSFAAPLQDTADLAAIVLTHEHADHWTPQHLARLLEERDVPVYAPEGVAKAAADFQITEVQAGQTVTAGPFELRFFGGVHNEIHSSIPLVDNVGVLVNGRFYYPGDSYSVPEGVDVALLAAPTGGPWLKIGEAMDFVLDVAPRAAFGVHEMTLSDAGKNMHRQRLRWATEQHGGTFHELEPGDALEI